ncbi:helix-turn-helix transcriptional regulator [Achromobacter insuavis]
MPPALATPCTERRFGDIASDWGYDGRVEAAHRPDTPAEQRVVAQGRIQMATTASGLRLCASDLLATRNHVRSADLNRSLTVYAMLYGPALDWRHGPAARPQRGAAHAAVLAVRDAARMTEIQRAGQRSRCLVVQVTPDSLGDAALAEQVQACLHRTQVGRCRRRNACGWRRPTCWRPGLAARSRACSWKAARWKCWLAACRAWTTRPPPKTRACIPWIASACCGCAIACWPSAHPHRLADLARDAGVSITTLKQKFPLAVGAPVFEYLRQVRLERARRGLLHEGWSVKQAAFYAGYRHPTNFTTAYRRRFGARRAASASPRLAAGIAAAAARIALE